MATTANLELKILRNLLTDERFTREVIPNLDIEYFTSDSKVIFENVVSFVNKYKKLPTADAFIIDLQKNERLGEDTFNKIRILEFENLEILKNV